MSPPTPGSPRDLDLIRVVGVLADSTRPDSARPGPGATGSEVTWSRFRVVISRPVLHGEDPAEVLARAGWAAMAVLDVHGRLGSLSGVRIRYVVVPALPSPVGPGSEPMPVHRDADLVLGPDEEPHVFQRLAAYAVVRSELGVLLTQYRDTTNVPGRWGLPGGGVDLGESVEQAVVREVWEETGQVAEPYALATVTTSRWIGRAPSGRVEDFHALRVVFTGWCADPVGPVVHDVDGTTSAAQWVPVAGLADVDVTQTARLVLAGLGLTGGG